MKAKTTLSLLFLTAATALVILPAAVAAQGNNPCWDMGRKSGGDVLVDVPETFDPQTTNNLDRNQIQCRELFREQAGTPVEEQSAVMDYRDALIALDIWTASRPDGANFEVYDPPIRICFDSAAFGVSASDAVGPAQLAAGENGPSIMYSDARYTFADRLSNNAYLGPSRNLTQLNVIVADEYICADISYPGSVVLVSGIPEGRGIDSPYHPNYGGDLPDRCLMPGDDDCIN